MQSDKVNIKKNIRKIGIQCQPVHKINILAGFYSMRFTTLVR